LWSCSRNCHFFLSILKSKVKQPCCFIFVFTMCKSKKSFALSFRTQQ
jgi:hypothetical protein